ncbi:MAG TPA: toll/interleukin-1 receptor domain-containing protein [Holophagaceae bacterium]|nr:toll/interleukin-1 receptor domain-containing protein [Holophagaceae bacterium]
MLYDVFICHASEDKDQLVRPLAKALRKENIVVWYDEFELKPGDSLRESIDRGLSKSRFGVVVLSHSFFRKKWTNRELNGLTARQMNGESQIIIPIWHEIEVEDVLKHSPPLADVFSIHSKDGIRKIVRKLIQTIRPQESPLVVARDELIYWGLNPPVISDEWWLDVIEASNKVSSAGFSVPESSTWGRWTFPLPNVGAHGEARGVRLAWTALQLKWEKEAEKRRVTQITPPEEVHAFIQEMPGLLDACEEFPEWLAVYAPQLTIPGFSGPFESTFSEMALQSRYREEMMLRDALEKVEPASAACNFVQGQIFGPECRYYSHFDYLIWLLSSGSKWLPAEYRDLLTRGMADWAVWPSGIEPREGDEEFLSWLTGLSPTRSRIVIPSLQRKYLISAITYSLVEIGSNDKATDILTMFEEHRVLNAYTHRMDRAGRKRKQAKVRQ